MLTERGNNMLYNFEVVDYECDNDNQQVKVKLECESENEEVEWDYANEEPSCSTTTCHGQTYLYVSYSDIVDSLLKSKSKSIWATDNELIELEKMSDNDDYPDIEFIDAWVDHYINNLNYEKVGNYDSKFMEENFEKNENEPDYE
jgi:hypothetical protein